MIDGEIRHNRVVSRFADLQFSPYNLLDRSKQLDPFPLHRVAGDIARHISETCTDRSHSAEEHICVFRVQDHSIVAVITRDRVIIIAAISG